MATETGEMRSARRAKNKRSICLVLFGARLDISLKIIGAGDPQIHGKDMERHQGIGYIFICRPSFDERPIPDIF